ncbi:hypothetical protein LOTGIDRAFT_160116 [Lottia gigantea]|uniref:Uncharacterized protein n=1 Tax=Lottia gigantea TaxID=225164 RepID=V4C3L1_LOTGI|nr:hypothetical protein LOTGIDRAFT_160116 [Lottia gigantea]ESO96129.1 hypothetical protein LOTGIDRAFT_160116 [Lottia gigantea]
MANKFGLGSLPLDTKKPNTTAWINKAKPYFVEQIGDTLQGDLDMNNFTITNLKLPENDYDAVHKKYLMDQLNLIEVNKDHLKERIGDVKRYFKLQKNNKDFIDDTKLQQEMIRLQNKKIDLKQVIANINPSISEDKLTTLETKLIDNSEIQKQIAGISEEKLTELETKIDAIKQQLLNVVDKTQFQSLSSLISNLDD